MYFYIKQIPTLLFLPSPCFFISFNNNGQGIYYYVAILMKNAAWEKPKLQYIALAKTVL
jgi:hypothetical protein